MAFGSLSLSGAVANAEIRKYLVEAEAALAAGDLTAAMTGAAVAFNLTMLDPNSSSPRLASGEGRFTLRGAALRGLGFHVPFSFSTRGGSEVENYVHKIGQAVTSSAEVFGEAITILGCGLDFTRYLQFKSQSPVVWAGFGKEPTVQWMREAPVDADLIEACVSFAVDAALLLGEEAKQVEQVAILDIWGADPSAN